MGKNKLKTKKKGLAVQMKSSRRREHPQESPKIEEEFKR